MKKAIYMFILLLLINIVSEAQNNDKNPIEITTEECLVKAKDYESQTKCYKEAQKKWEINIDKYYKKLSDELYLDTKELIDKSQQTWIQYKKHEFDAIEDMLSQLNGDFYDMMEAKARMNIIMNRAIELELLYSILHQP